MNHVDKKNGFTLIELMLAMGFVSVLLIAIAMTVIQIGNIYNRGLTLKEVNQSGRSISAELQRSIASSSPFYIDPGVGSQYVDKKSGVENYYIRWSWGGRLCLNQYSYIWNYGKDIQPLNLNNSRNKYVGLNANKVIRFVKVFDSDSYYCKNPAGSYPDVIFDNAVELLEEGEYNLAIHQFDIANTFPAAVDSKTGQQLYNISFLIGTNEQAALMSSNTQCRPPSDSNANMSYCSVNQFNIVVRAGNTIR